MEQERFLNIILITQSNSDVANVKTFEIETVQGEERMGWRKEKEGKKEGKGS